MTLKEEGRTIREFNEAANGNMRNAAGEKTDGIMAEIPNEIIIEEADGTADPLKRLEAELSAARADADEWRDRFMRKAAEFENYRKRMDREKSELRISSQSVILRDILPVLDGFDRALKYLGEADGGAGSAARWREGVDLLYRQMSDALAQAGVAPIDAKGKPFDPHLHEAISREETSKFADGTVVAELRRGYMFKDSLLRPSQVIVAVQPA